MSKYTLVNNSSADLIIENDLSQIVKVLVESFGDVVISILLMGSFGKGEGSVVKENDRYRPLNDYGIAICVGRNKSSEVRKKLATIISKIQSLVSVKQVDVSVIEYWKLIIPIPSTSRYDLSRGNKVLYGRKIIIASVPSRFIPLEEGVRYFRNRGGGLLISRLLLDGFGNFLEKKRLELAQIEINKALIVIGDASLILSGKYHYRYLERMRRVQNGFGRGITQEGKRNYIKAVKTKLDAKTNLILGRNDLIDQLNKVLDLYLNHFIHFENIRLKKHFKSLNEYLSYYNSNNVRDPRLIWSRLWSNENNESNIKLRCQLFSLLNQLRRKLDKHDYELWQRSALNFLVTWRNYGIILKFHANTLRAKSQ